MLFDVCRKGNEEAQASAAAALANLVPNEENKMTIVREGGLGVLLDVCRKGNEEAQAEAARALVFLASTTSTKAIIVSEGGISLFVAIAKTGNAAAEHAAKLLEKLALNNDQNRSAIQKEGWSF